MIPRVVLATQNAGKARELTALLQGPVGIVESLADHPHVPLPDEGEASYHENARAKAAAVAAATGLPAIGDDSGLEVDALDGAPGIRSARFAGENAEDLANNALLLRRMARVPQAGRTARFRCVLVLIHPGGSEISAEGICEGTILDAPRGSGGFGYDPLFLPYGETRSFAELSPEVKGAISHRGRAAAALRAALVEAGAR